MSSSTFCSFGGRARVAPQVGARSQGQAREIRNGGPLRSAAPVWGNGPPSRREQAPRVFPAVRPHKRDAPRTGPAQSQPWPGSRAGARANFQCGRTGAERGLWLPCWSTAVTA